MASGSMAGSISCKDGRITVFNNQGALLLMDGVSPHLHRVTSVKKSGVLALRLQAPAASSRHEVGSCFCCAVYCLLFVSVYRMP